MLYVRIIRKIFSNPWIQLHWFNNHNQIFYSLGYQNQWMATNIICYWRHHHSSSFCPCMPIFLITHIPEFNTFLLPFCYSHIVFIIITQLENIPNIHTHRWMTKKWVLCIYVTKRNVFLILHYFLNCTKNMFKKKLKIYSSCLQGDNWCVIVGCKYTSMFLLSTWSIPKRI